MHPDKSESQIDDLVDAMWQLLDDMGRDSLCVCGLAKAQARIAFEPFYRPEDHGKLSMTFEEAKQIDRRVK